MGYLKGKRSLMIFDRHVNLRQYRTILFVWLRREIFRQFVRKCCRQARACQNIFVQDDGKYPSKRAEKAIAVNCAVLP